MTQQAAENRSWLVAKLQERGIYDEVRAKAMAIVFGSIEYEVTWQKAFALAYADGHNVRHLGGKRLGHYASAYADLCEEAGAVLVPDAFFQAWDEGAVFEGTETGHWHYA